jgi:RecB family exonuclease
MIAPNMATMLAFLLTDVSVAPRVLQAALRDVAGRRFDDFERRIPVGYPVAWEATRRRMVETLEAFVAWDLARLAEEGFRPLLFEEEGEGEITVGGGEAGRIACHGYMDRVDVRDGGDVLHYRIVDYKSGRVPEKAVEPAALRGEKLQLPVYLVIARPALRRAIAAKRIPDRPLAPAASSYYYLAEAAAAGEPRVVTLGGDFWDRRKAEMDETLRRLVGGIRAGFFLIRPGSYCRFCEYAAICRKGHYPTARRSRGDAGWGLYRPTAAKKETADGRRETRIESR